MDHSNVPMNTLYAEKATILEQKFDPEKQVKKAIQYAGKQLVQSVNEKFAVDMVYGTHVGFHSTVPPEALGESSKLYLASGLINIFTRHKERRSKADLIVS